MMHLLFLVSSCTLMSVSAIVGVVTAFDVIVPCGVQMCMLPAWVIDIGAFVAERENWGLVSGNIFGPEIGEWVGVAALSMMSLPVGLL